MKKFNNCRNVIGNLIKKHREEKHYTKADLSHKLELLGIELDRFELYKIETAKTSVKDFELIGLCIVLDIDFERIKEISRRCFIKLTNTLIVFVSFLSIIKFSFSLLI